MAKNNRMVYQRGSVADAYRRSVEGYTARIRELEQRAQAVLSLANAAIGEPAGDIRMIDSMYIKAHAGHKAAVRTLAVQKGKGG